MIGELLLLTSLLFGLTAVCSAFEGKDAIFLLLIY